MLRCALIIDYQNIHLVAGRIFAPGQKVSQSLIDPSQFATQVVQVRNEKMNSPDLRAEVTRIQVYRGLPSSDRDPKGHAANLRQKKLWESDPRVVVTLRPLTYQVISDPVSRSQIVRAVEKGVDVLCALSIVRESRRSDVDLVIVASHDSDLVPALDEVLSTTRTRIETASWSSKSWGARIRPDRRNIWNTYLQKEDFEITRMNRG